MGINKIGVFKDFKDNALKSVFEVGKSKIIDMVLYDDNNEKDIISVPTHYWCNIGCGGCDLCNNKKNKMLKIKAGDFIECLVNFLKHQNFTGKETIKTELEIVFDGIGDGLLNLELIKDIYLKEKYIKSSLGYKKINYVITTIIPNNEIAELIKVVNDFCIPLKVELLVRDKKEIEEKAEHLKSYLEQIKKNKKNYKKIIAQYGKDEFVEIVYPINNESKQELLDICKTLTGNNISIKFLNINNEPQDNAKYQNIINEIINNNFKLNVKLKKIKGLDVNSTCKIYSKHYFHCDEVSMEEAKQFESWKIKHRVHENQRKDYLCWDEYFMAIAKLTAMRSKDPNTQVGACIVGEDNRILSIGYNGSPNGYKDECFPWQREGKALDTKYMYVVHAERNAILNYRGSRRDFEKAKIYVDLFPCNECAKEIIQAGIREVIYLSDKYATTDSTIASKRLFDACNVKYRQLDKTNCDKITLNLDIVD